ncbi:hypothetical protein [Burkholderia cepacia]|uniref:hypothetical protein n=1 Tax=Burkholderia cepacia TaxID=292 RepID=UPI000F5F5AB6|nr:hypothetical protein [Burkholderia cepacia]
MALLDAFEPGFHLSGRNRPRRLLEYFLAMGAPRAILPRNPAASLVSRFSGRERKRLRVASALSEFVLHYRGFGPASRPTEPEIIRKEQE